MKSLILILSLAAMTVQAECCDKCKALEERVAKLEEAEAKREAARAEREAKRKASAAEAEKRERVRKLAGKAAKK